MQYEFFLAFAFELHGTRLQSISDSENTQPQRKIIFNGYLSCLEKLLDRFPCLNAVK